MMKVVPVRVGDQYQAEIPPLRSKDQQEADRERALREKPRCKQQWTPSRFNEDEITEFLRTCCRLNETETGLQCLYESDFQVPTAVELIYGMRRRKMRKQRVKLEAVPDQQFEQAILKHGKRFFRIQHEWNSPQVTTKDIVCRFYDWKTSAAYAKWRERIKAKKNKERARLRQWDDSDDSDASSYHNEYCELCFTGGQLLCCDGCERAYHFSCVTPPIKDVPTEDWYCSHCTQVMSSSLLVRESEENAHCGEAVLVEEIEPEDEEADVEEEAEAEPEEDAENEKADDSERETRCESPNSVVAATDSDASEREARPVRRRASSVSDPPVPASSRPSRMAAASAVGSTPTRLRKRMADATARSYSPLSSNASTPSTPSFATNGTNNSSSATSGRKRQRKTLAPRRIPQPRAAKM